MKYVNIIMVIAILALGAAIFKLHTKDNPQTTPVVDVKPSDNIIVEQQAEIQQLQGNVQDLQNRIKDHVVEEPEHFELEVKQAYIMKR